MNKYDVLEKIKVLGQFIKSIESVSSTDSLQSISYF